MHERPTPGKPFPWRTLGRTEERVGPLGLGSSYGLEQRDVEWAVDHGCNYLYWGSLRRGGFGRAMRHLASSRRQEVVFVVQSYARFGWLVRRSVESALRKLGTDYADILLLGMWNKPVKPSVLEAAARLRDEGKCRFLAASTHQRLQAHHWLTEDAPTLDVLHVRYNAAHRGAEDEVFPARSEGGPGVVAFTATRWGTLLTLPSGEQRAPTAADCYRFVLSHPAVDVCLAGPSSRAELEEAVQAVERGPLSEEEETWMRNVGDAIYRARGGRGDTTFLRR